MAENSHSVTHLLIELSQGDTNAMDKLIPQVYQELRKLAASYLRKEKPGQTLQTTALVHEAYVKLVDQRAVKWQNRAHFYGIAAQLMRRILIDQARQRKALKRGGNDIRLSFDEALHGKSEPGEELLALNDAMERLSKIDERQAKIVELRYFGGLNIEETAQVLSTSASTVKRDWNLARAWLHREMQTWANRTKQGESSGNHAIPT